MLEVKNLKKIYKTKKGADVNALDGVSLQFPETGMVFLLGKSGSGKSTLLNVCGGLDQPTEGEIIVKGRSSKDFSQSDFDSYRNTFVGFIFQEYNILNEFSVEENIALALELQGKPKDKAAIDALLDEVDLKGFAKRKPNTLSGGQKQRIAIARALIKAPEIIMADEPTGALDSNTGKQVLDTLKKLSRQKLIIVVSHDRDFAEQYADRIIELKDGKVLSDVSKTELKQQALSENIHTVGDVLCIRRGTDLNEQDFERIKSFLKQSEQDVIIAKNDKDVEAFKKVSRINDSGEKEVFCETDPAATEKKQYTKEDSRFIRSKLPLKHAVKIGASGLRNKPLRLFFTVLLCTVAFAFFGLISTLNFYDSHATFVQSLRDTGTSVMQTAKEYQTKTILYVNGEKDYEYDGYQTGMFTDAERKDLAAQFSSDAFGAVEVYSNFNLSQITSDYWINEIAGFAVLPEGNSLRGQINGSYPKTADEIMITTYAASMIQNCKMYDSEGNGLQLSSPTDILGKKITLSGHTYTVTGILDSGEISPEFDALRDAIEPNYNLSLEYQSYLRDGLHLLVFVNEERLEKIAEENPSYDDGPQNYTNVTVALRQQGQYPFPEWSNTTYVAPSLSNFKGKLFALSSSAAEPGEKEAILSSILFSDLVSTSYRAKAENVGENYTLADYYYTRVTLADEVRQRGTYQYDEATDKHNFLPFTTEELEKKIQQLIDAVKEDDLDLSLGLRLFDSTNSTSFGDTSEFTILGVYADTSDTYTGKLLLSQTDFDRLWSEQKGLVDFYSEVTSTYTEPKDALYSKLYLPFTYTEETANAYWEVYNSPWGEDNSRVTLTGSFVNNLKMIDETVKSLSTVFLYVGIVLAIFAALLFSNFISVSISQKKREIGILRAVGARSADVFKIFFSESFVIAAICVVLSTVGSILICGVINSTLAAEIGASLFVFGVASFAVLVAVALVTVIAATFLPVYHAAKKKPVDSIRAL